MLYSLQCEYSLWDFKAALCSFGEEIQTQIIIIYNINEVTIQTQKCSFSHNWRKIKKVPRTLLEARDVAGSATFKQSKTSWNCVVI